MKQYVLITLSFLFAIFNSYAQVGLNDPGFDPGSGASSGIISVAVQSDSKILAAGTFSTFNGVLKNRLARLNSDGSIDPAFSSTVAANNSIYQVGELSSGKLLACGQFTTYGGVAANRVARINADGSRDAGFNSSVGANNFVYSFAEQPDGKIIIGGGFNLYGGSARGRVARVNANGSVDPTFTTNTGANNNINAVALQPDGKILIGGIFTTYNGISNVRIARLNSNGSLDAGFITGTGIAGTGATVYSIIVQPDGKILVGGIFTSYKGVAKNNLIRLNSDGTLDATFNTGSGPMGGYVKNMILQPDGKIIAVGSFSSYNGISKSRIVRINSDGTLDATFGGTGGNGTISAVALQPNGDFIIGGNFSTYSGDSRLTIARAFGTCSSVTASLTGQTNNMCGNGSAGSASVTAAGGASFSYTWLPSGGNTDIATGLSAGSYTCLISNECLNTATVNVTIAEPAAISLTTGISSTVCAGTSATLSATASGGTGSLNYTWEPGSLAGANQTVSPSISTVYTVTATDDNGCVLSGTQNIDVNASPIISITGGTSTACSGSTVTLIANGGTSYIWSTGDNTPSISVSPTVSTTYSVTNTEANGCSRTASRTVTVAGTCATSTLPCGITISNLNSTSSAANVTGAISYRFKIYDNTTNALLGTRVQTSRTFTFNTMSNILFYGSTYKWTVAVDKGTGFGPESNSSCTVTFAEPKTTVPCGVSYSNLSAYTACQFISAAKNYRFSFYNNTTNALVAVKTQTSNYIYFNTVPGLAYGNTYKWTVEIEYDNGTTLLYGPASSTACTITFNPPKTTVPCGVTYAKTAYTSVPFVSGATGFRYNFYDAATSALITSTINTNQYIYFNQIPGLIFNKAYVWTVEVRYNNGSGNVFGPASTNTCTMNYGTPAAIVINNNDLNDANMRQAKEESSISTDPVWINVYPNPAKDKVYVESAESVTSLKIYNVSGEMVLDQASNNQEINLSDFKAGIYFIYVQTENELKHFQIIKE
ncbi:MAG: Delta-60 repeat-containing protein [Bacteroidetes bacterium]|jgi:uncharacterized delta-60 repeat protein|nr:Delta-60 repeat-containing protein [Bacteroidota bacterium]